jgi:NAD(P)-dependent dehydrogenase (short-subunit alcohol dehydrogenase family)
VKTVNFLAPCLNIIMSTYLITGCSRGLGLSMVANLLARPSFEVALVFATARSESPALQELRQKYTDRIVVLQLDVNNAESVKRAVVEAERVVGGKGLDVLLNNAGIMPYTPEGIAGM